MKQSIVFLFALCGLFLLQSCEKETDLANDDFEALGAPELPNLDLFTVPVSSFEEIQNDKSLTKSNTKWHWLHAGLNILGWNTAVVANLAIPVAAIGEAFNQEYEYLGEGIYEWAYRYDGPRRESFQVNLQGAYLSTEDEIGWTLRLTDINSGESFVWLTGKTMPFASEFVIYQNPEEPNVAVSLTTTVDPNSEDRTTTRFTNINPNRLEDGYYVEYRQTPDALYNRSYEVFRTDEDFLQIELNEPAGDGRVRHLSHYGDNNWRCWDVEQNDVDCE
ncbi:MAG: hypothetical protein AAGI23_06735 [Bacteroidota bacterium]